MLKRVSTFLVALAMLLTMVCSFSFASAAEPMELVWGTTDLATVNTNATQAVTPGQELYVVVGVKNYMPCASVAVMGEYDRTKLSVVNLAPTAPEPVWYVSPTEMSEKTLGGIVMSNPSNVVGGKTVYYHSWTNASNMEVNSGNAIIGFTPIPNFNLFYLKIKVADNATGSIPVKFSFDEAYMRYYTPASGNNALIPTPGTDYIVEGPTITLQIACTNHDVKNAVDNGVYSHGNTCALCGEPVNGITAGACSSTTPGTVHPATCTTAGYTEYAACDVCGEPFTVAGDPAKNHHFVADGDNGAATTYSCDQCDDTNFDNLACEFDAGVPVASTDPCTKAGTIKFTCQKSGYIYEIDDPANPVVGHKYDNAPYISDNAGKHYQECTVCSTPNTAVDCDLSWNATAEDHKCDLCGHEVSCVWGDWTWNNVNTKDGSKHIRTCPVGGTHTEEEACTWDNGTGSATCTTPGDTTFKCTNATCQGTYAVSGAALGHKYKHDAGTEGAAATMSCDRCDDTAFDGIPCDFDAGVPVASADPCDVAGTIKYTCQETGYNYSVTDPSAPALGHDYSHDAGTEGAAATMSCSRGDSANVPCDFDAGVKVPSTDPCTKPGTIKYTCQETSYSYEVDDPDVPALGHNFVADGDNGAATTYSCDRCANTAFDNLPCEFDAGVPIASTDPCDVAGTIKYTCAKSNYSYVVTDPNAPALGHDYKHDAGTEGAAATMSCTRGDSANVPCNFDGGVYNGATCDKGGYTRYTCADCGYYHDVEDANAPATGHDYSHDAGTEDAAATMSCSKCDSDNIPCDFDAGVKVPSTDPCEKPGTIKYTCQETQYSYEVDDPTAPATGHKVPDNAVWTYDGSGTNHVHSTTSTCATCGDDIASEACDFEIKTPASTTPGLKKCKVCGHEEEIPANACAHGIVKEEYKAPTKNVPGYINNRCTACNEVVSGTELPAGDHFKDLAAGANVWYYDAAVFAKSYGIIIGEYDYLYADRAITRGEVVTILGRDVVNMLLENGTIAKDITKMTDAEFNTLLKYLGNKHVGKFQDLKGDYYDRYVKLLNQFGIALGHDDGRFAGDDVVTREELAAFMVRYVEYKAAANGAKITDYTFGTVVKAFKDADKTSAWAKATVETARDTGLFQGEYECFNATDNATRGQVATLMTRVMVAIDNITIVK